MKNGPVGRSGAREQCCLKPILWNPLFYDLFNKVTGTAGRIPVTTITTLFDFECVADIVAN